MHEEFDGRTRTKIVRDADGIARRKAQPGTYAGGRRLPCWMSP
jgi:hypothetical protein